MPESQRVVRSHALREGLTLHDVLEPEIDDAEATGTKVVATLGPACHEVPILVELLKAGAVGGRVDLTWGPLPYHLESLRNLQAASKEARKLCAVIVDTLGRELMIRRPVNIDESGWPVHEPGFEVTAGQQVTITTRLDAECCANPCVLPITYEGFTDMVRAGDNMYVGRYLVSGGDCLYLEVQEVRGPDVICMAKNATLLDGLLTVFHTERSANMGEQLNVQNALPLLSDYDKDALRLIGREFEIDFISLSYTRTDEDVREARQFLQSIGQHHTKVLAKLESRQSLINFQSILSEADGIIISRGNLGLDVVSEKMCMVQKMLIQDCNVVGKPCLITRVVDTMISAPRPTRAEATDVANAVLDGVDVILLGAETLRGKHPVNTVRTIRRICLAAEKVFDHRNHYEYLAQIDQQVEDEAVKQLATQYGVSPHVWGSYLAMGSQMDLTSVGGKGSYSSDGPVNANPAYSMPELNAIAHGQPHGPPHGMSLHGRSHLSSMSGAIPGTPPLGPPGLPSRLSATTAHKSGTQAMMAANPSVASELGVFRVQGNVGGGSSGNLSDMVGGHMLGQMDGSSSRTPWLSKLECITSSAVLAADKVGASLMLVFTHSGGTAALIAKYRPPIPIIALVVPNLVSNGLSWQLEGRTHARQMLLTRGCVPMLTAPATHNDEVLENALKVCTRLGMVKPHDKVVVVQRSHHDFGVKIVSIDELGLGIKKILRTPSMLNCENVPQDGPQTPAPTPAPEVPQDRPQTPVSEVPHPSPTPSQTDLPAAMLVA
mmetsp:Transcript_7041/g.11978  ORF Transcript_7041/g.11978 Transcript_7041/m.11978 type:complete len:775 (-) Transcript_7041:276-2600(-)